MRIPARMTWVASSLAMVLFGCSSSDAETSPGSGGVGGSTGLGGSANSGGSPGLGGASQATFGANTGGTAITGGSTFAGGNTSQGGNTAPSGGMSATGGSNASGGKTPVGGSMSTGGSQSSGGSSATGGSKATGGSQSSGGSSATGGSKATGGSQSSGGSSVNGGTGAGGTGTYEPCPASGDCKVLPLGDSITWGIGFDGSYRVQLFAKAIADKKKITFVGSVSNGPATVSGVTFPKANEGHSGWTIQQIDDKVPTPYLDPKPHITLLHLGTNDMAQGAVGATERLKALVNQIVTTLPDSLLVVSTIIPLPLASSAVTTFNAAVSGIVQEQASKGKHVIFVDQFKGFPTSELGDGVHPNEAGYARMAGVWYAAIKGYLH